jgi:hypothetical protein
VNVAGVRLERPIFLVASERSGSNLMRSILGAHSRISAPPPPHLLSTFCPLLPRYGDLRDADARHHLCEDVVRLLQEQLSAWSSSVTVDDLMACDPDLGFLGMVDEIYAREQDASEGSTRCFFKEIDTQEYVFPLLRVYPDALFVYLVRDARDLVLSALNSPNHVGTPAELAMKWRDEQAKMLEVYSMLGLESRIHAVHYEDLLVGPEEIVKGLCDFIGEPFEAGMLEYFKGEAARKQARDVSNWRNLEKPILVDNYRKFETAMSPDRIAEIEQIAGREMVLCDYPLRGERVGRRAGLGGMARKAGQLLVKLASGKSLSVREISARRRQLQARGRIEADLEARMHPLIRRRLATY